MFEGIWGHHPCWIKILLEQIGSRIVGRQHLICTERPSKECIGSQCSLLHPSPLVILSWIRKRRSPKTIESSELVQPEWVDKHLWYQSRHVRISRIWSIARSNDKNSSARYSQYIHSHRGPSPVNSNTNMDSKRCSRMGSFHYGNLIDVHGWYEPWHLWSVFLFLLMLATVASLVQPIQGTR